MTNTKPTADEARAKMAEVIALAEQDGFFIVDAKNHDEGQELPTLYTIRHGASGALFAIYRDRTYNKGNQLVCELAGMRDSTGNYVSPRDVQPYGRAISSDARASANRSAASILADFRRRVIDREDVQDVARQLRELIDQRDAYQNRQQATRATLETMGFDFREREPEIGYLLSRTGRQPYRARIVSSTDARIEVDCTPAQLAQILALLAAE